jgi:Leu/Phe-tRNA-protein transferase
VELPWVDGKHPSFPSPSGALSDPDGLLAVGGTLSTNTLLTAYRQGIFPWYEVPQPILWWSPSARAILVPGEQHISRSLRKKIRKGGFEISSNRAFDAVVYGCAGPRAKARGTWITPQMRRAYCDLHKLGHAHSVEYWLDGRLAQNCFTERQARSDDDKLLIAAGPGSYLKHLYLYEVSSKIPESLQQGPLNVYLSPPDPLLPQEFLFEVFFWYSI